MYFRYLRLINESFIYFDFNLIMLLINLYNLYFIWFIDFVVKIVNSSLNVRLIYLSIENICML